MSFKQYLRKPVAERLDETYQQEDWAPRFPGRAYYDVHLSVIDDHELNAPVFREFLEGSGKRILESGCGTGRWMAYFERLGHRAVGVDDSWGPLAVAREHDGGMRLVRGDVRRTPFRAGVFDAALSAYVAEHFEEGPVALFREIHRVLKPGGLLFVVVPFDNTFRRWLVNPVVRLGMLACRVVGKALAFTEFRYTRAEMDGFLRDAAFEPVRVVPDDYTLPWSKGLYVDACDVGSYVRLVPKRPYEFGRVGQAVVRTIQRFGAWRSCAGIFYVARAQK